MPDALGSVRQIADAAGNVTLAKSYEPYGAVLNGVNEWPRVNEWQLARGRDSCIREHSVTPFYEPYGSVLNSTASSIFGYAD